MRRGSLIAILAICLYFNGARAQMDAASQGVLIDKLEKVYQHLPSQDAAKVGVTLRLADLYAERARQESMKAEPTGADPAGDRAKALRLYNEVLERAPEASKAKIIMQMGHLHQLNGHEDKAIALYQQNLKGEQDPQMRAEAHLSLGEIYFKRRDFNKALAHYAEVLEQPQSPSKGLAAYRRAWSHFHMGQVQTAVQELEKLLRSPDMLSRSAAGRGQIDTQFHEEVARDFSTFMAKVAVTKERIDVLFEVSPASTKIANGQNLAFELERLGKKDEALLTWTIVSGLLSQPVDRLASHLSMAQLHLDKADKIAALKSYEFAMQTWKDLGFKDSPQEQELKRRARHFVVAWNQSEKKKPSTELLTAYENYLTMFGNDVDARLYAAQAAQEQFNWPAAWTHYLAARDLLLTDKTAADKLETVILSQIELSESAKDATLMQQAYDSYIKHSPKKTKLLEVQYQKARALYDKGEYGPAAEELRILALTGKSSPQLRKQAADLSLDALVLIKDENRLLTWAREYEGAFPANKADFSQIVQKTVLTKSANLAESNPAAALAALNDFDPAQATAEDKAKFYKNKLILAEKQGHIREAAAAADSLLSLQNISMEDRELAWGRKAYFAELRLDFSTAFAAVEKLEKTFPVDEKNFKLAVFAELSGRQSSPFYMNYLSQTKDAERKQLVAAELVRKAKNPEAEVEKVRGILVSNPTLLAQLYAEIYAKSGKDIQLKKVTADAKLRETEAGRLMQRQAFLKDFAIAKKPLVADRLDTSSNNKLAASIKRRAALLVKTEELTKRSIQSGDWTAQLVSIDLLARESERFYQDLLSAPVPQGLSPEEEQEYLGLLSAQAMPYQTKASEAKAKVAQFWTSTDWTTPLTVSWQQKNIRKLIAVEIEALKEVAPEDQRAKLEGFKDEIQLATRPSVQEMQQARQKVFENPMDRAALESLLALERKNDNVAMSEYLSTRLERLNKGAL